ncbi:hypothetical protein GCK72_021620 [Caenorhabditis remanei]|uniref:Uncharacterized protein n=1 Tax=Caenorhabditis remanei TaxID=31234 RepID=A0A6A5GKL3_CAERE|nr:hypothetical protein GCK72_021620 [Caenorhabditis remanei]KAF1755052.1 hypothetical protein GCK72_021620 [Caenorhabditis remanei]
MEIESSSSTSSATPNNCVVCDLPAKGMNFGAFTCRACAAFFRRAAHRTSIKKCGIHSTYLLSCKKCRLQKCYEVGMSTEKFQFYRDQIIVRKDKKDFYRSFEQFVGRPFFVLNCDPEISVSGKKVIDCMPLIEMAARVFAMGSESPLFSKNRLVKLAQGLQQFQNPSSALVEKFETTDMMSSFEAEFLKTCKWFTYLDEIQMLSGDNKKLSVSAMGRINGFDNAQFGLWDLNEMNIDVSWCTNYSNEQIRYFLETNYDSYLYQLLDEMVALRPNDVELSYMLCQLCLQYAGQRFQGEILEFSEKVMSLLADDLHSYYGKQLKMHNYAGRVAKLIKINNRINKAILETRQRQHIADVFDIWTIEFSHPEFIVDA